MKLIEIRYIAPTNFRGTRWVACDGDNPKMYAPYDYGDEDGHCGRLDLAHAYAAKYWRNKGVIVYVGSHKDSRFYGMEAKK
mgnify:CR=1 FL=1